MRKVITVKTIGRKICLALGGLTATLALIAAPASAAGPTNPQLDPPKSPAAAAAAAPDLCHHWAQDRPAQMEQRYRNNNNVPFTYTNTVYGANWFDVACGDLTFYVTRGEEALVDLDASAELDCQSNGVTNSWCGSRFLINSQPVARPDNTGRGDTYAWDSANGGAFDWQANVNNMVYRATCPADRELTTPCTYKVQLQSRLENGATSVWIDDLTMQVDVFEGKVVVTSGKTTP